MKQIKLQDRPLEWINRYWLNDDNDDSKEYDMLRFVGCARKILNCTARINEYEHEHHIYIISDGDWDDRRERSYYRAKRELAEFEAKARVYEAEFSISTYSLIKLIKCTRRHSRVGKVFDLLDMSETQIIKACKRTTNTERRARIRELATARDIEWIEKAWKKYKQTELRDYRIIDEYLEVDDLQDDI